ncbi:putative polypeptide N-acetylgalactosaminyltransferase 13 [Phlebotomus argentipes]|uniref:putative polypeptide N-acetylgalactosaminyltransferase 13 n=1 Tax=Phlebotomus argentipes TaxID=94469 RepID=UPI002892BB25|nr:putative polypeptide N-acetylgalactosaminyltransferase 13 [Phlebotomus argentipes]
MLRRGGLRFLHRKLGFFGLIVSTVIFIFYTLTILPPVEQKVRRKVAPVEAILNFSQSDFMSHSDALSTAFEEHYFNLSVSNSLSSGRDIPDTRPPRCRAREYVLNAKKNVSVIVVFHNEAKSALLRTISSVINRTPPDLLHEIILIDDFSRNGLSANILENLPKIKLYRNHEREGLIRSRKIGALHASAEYIVFLDSHCEVNVGWVEPLIDRLSYHPGALVSPIIDIIDASTFEYRATTTNLKAGFDWSLRFKWIPRSDEELHTVQDETSSFASPTVYGGIFLISRQWFHQLGGFDSNLEIWGGESLEISLKAWMCGGQVEIAPCSRVGHVFRKKHPYDFPRGSTYTFLRNSKLIAEVWLDEYKHFFYFARPNAQSIKIKDTKDAATLKEKLQCRTFSWYLQTVFHELKLPNEEHIAFGELKHEDRCLSVTTDNSRQRHIQLANCYSHRETTKWALHNYTGALSPDSGGCVNVFQSLVILEYCRNSPAQRWLRNGGNLMHATTGKCLESLVGPTVAVSACRHGSQSQLWSFSVEVQHQ